MSPSGATPRRPQPRRAVKAAVVGAPTIRVVLPIAPLAPEPVDHVMDLEVDLSPALPCSGRCGHCNYHPCRLHSTV